MVDQHEPPPNLLEDGTKSAPVVPTLIQQRPSIRLEARVIGPKGIEMTVVVEHVGYDGLDGTAQRALSFETALLAKGLKPVPAPTPIVTAGPSGAAGGEAVEIPGEGGAPPKCSLHGPMEWKEGTSQGTGKPYAFWACKIRNCRPKKAA